MTDQELRAKVKDLIISASFTNGYDDFVPDEYYDDDVNEMMKLISQAQLAILEQVRLKLSPVNGMWDWNAAVKELDKKIDTLKAGIEKGEQV